jgi:hypothetical protein
MKLGDRNRKGQSNWLQDEAQQWLRRNAKETDAVLF